VLFSALWLFPGEYFSLATPLAVIVRWAWLTDVVQLILAHSVQLVISQSEIMRRSRCGVLQRCNYSLETTRHDIPASFIHLGALKMQDQIIRVNEYERSRWSRNCLSRQQSIPHWTVHPITQSRSSCRLRSSYLNRLAVPSVKLSIGSRSFSVSGLTVWNALPDYLRNPTLSIGVFKRYLKPFYLLSINATLQRIRNIVPLRYINW